MAAKDNSKSQTTQLTLAVLGLLFLGVVMWWRAPAPPSPVTNGNYIRLQNGMSSDEAIAILGTPSETINARPGVSPGTASTTCNWRSPDGVIITAVFTGDKLTSKSLGSY